MTNKILLYRILLFFWITGIFYVSLVPDLSKLSFLPNNLIPSILHPIAFFILFFLFYLSSANRGKNPKWVILLICFVLTLTISFSKEVCQLFAPGRTFSFGDILVDGIAALAALTITAGISSVLERVL